MIIIAGNSNIKLAQAIAIKLQCQCIKADIRQFEDHELCIQIKGSFQGEDVVIVQSTSKPANDHLMEVLLIADAARRAGARHITAMMPYFGYSRQDRASSSCGAVSADLVAKMLESAGVDRVVTMDIHSQQVEKFFNIEMVNIQSSQLFALLLRDDHDCVIISPDSGGISRARALSDFLGLDLAVISKFRDAAGVCRMGEIAGEVEGRHCVIIDDIVDTGATLYKAAELLMQRGALSVKAYVTHAVLSGKAAEMIKNSAIDALYVSDSIVQNKLPNKIAVISSAQVLADGLK